MGVLDTQNRIDPQLLETMQRALYHRGPDDSGFEIFSMDSTNNSYLSNVGIAFDRLSIRDLSIKGHQPMLSDDRSVMIAFNGEIYNSEELRPILLKEGYTFNGNSDTEVLLKLYHCYGIDKTLSMLDGMYAICISDFRKKEIYLIRDRIGEKPLYLFTDERKLLFASEYKAFYAHPDFKAVIDETAMDEYFMFRYISGEQTFLKGVRNLSPGSYLKVSVDGFSHHVYWSLPNSEVSDKSFEECKKDFDKLLQKSISRRLISDRPIGCQLSGGVDSSYLCSVVKNGFDKSLKSYCITFDNKEFSEEPYIDFVNNQLDLQTEKLTFLSKDFIKYWEKSTWFFEAPMNHEGTLALCNLNEIACKEVAVMLCGDGPDECMGGYTRAYDMSLKLGVKPLSKLGLKLKLRDIKEKLRKHIYRIKQQDESYESIDDYYIAQSQWIEKRLFERLRPDSHSSVQNVYAKRKKILSAQSGTGLRKYLNYEMYTFMQDILMRSDKISMAASIELRVPYLMPELLEYIQTIPTKYLVDVNKNPNYGTKVLLKSLCNDAFGKKFTYRSKMGLSFPFIDYFSDKVVRDFIEKEVLPNVKKRKLVNINYVTEIWNDIPKWKQANQYNWRILHMIWCVFSFEIWANMYIDNNPLTYSYNGQNIIQQRRRDASHSGNHELDGLSSHEEACDFGLTDRVQGI